MVTFEKAAELALKLPENTTNEERLILYKLYKQATVGDCNTSRPGILDQKGRAKWDAWNSVKGKSQEEAKEEYTAKVEELLEKYDVEA